MKIKAVRFGDLTNPSIFYNNFATTPGNSQGRADVSTLPSVAEFLIPTLQRLLETFSLDETLSDGEIHRRRIPKRESPFNFCFETRRCSGNRGNRRQSHEESSPVHSPKFCRKLYSLSLVAASDDKSQEFRVGSSTSVLLAASSRRSNRRGSLNSISLDPNSQNSPVLR